MSKKNNKNQKKPKCQPRPVKKQGKTKYDWPSLKQEFFESDYQECLAFFKSKYGRFDGNMSKQSRGWPGDKRAWRNAEVQLSLQNLQSDRVAGLKETLDKIVALCRGEIDTMAKKGVKVKSLVKIWEVLRTESGLPKAISHNINDNNNIDLAAARQSLLDKVNKGLPKK